MKKQWTLWMVATAMTLAASAQPTATRTFTIVKQNPITSIKNQHRSGTCWAYATLAFFESEVLRRSGRTVDLCEMFVVNKDYMDNATHYVRLHGHSQLTEGGSADDVLDILQRHGICPEEAMPAPGSLVGDSLANFSTFIPVLEEAQRSAVVPEAKHPADGWQERVQQVIDRHVGACPTTFVHEGKTYTPQTFAASLGLDWADYVSLTSYTHHPFGQPFVIESPYKWRLKPSYNLPVDQLLDALDAALDRGYCVAWGGDVSGDFGRDGLARLAPGTLAAKPAWQDVQALRQQQWDDWTFTYDHVMLIYGRATDADGNPYYMVKNSWGRQGMYDGTWYMSRDYMALNTTYLFLNRHALPRHLQREIKRHLPLDRR
ncbi:MAG: aminopeptidase [Bacteroidaceae bacterium]|nr:aminopeptidase [Bacteroidaceae bacterium]